MDSETLEYMKSLDDDEREYILHRMEYFEVESLTELERCERAESIGIARAHIQHLCSAIEAGEQPPAEEVVKAIEQVALFPNDLELPTPIVEQTVIILRRKTQRGRKGKSKYFPDKKYIFRPVAGRSRNERIADRYDQLTGNRERGQSEAVAVIRNEFGHLFVSRSEEGLTDEAIIKAVSRGRAERKKRDK